MGSLFGTTATPRATAAASMNAFSISLFDQRCTDCEKAIFLGADRCQAARSFGVANEVSTVHTNLVKSCLQIRQTTDRTSPLARITSLSAMSLSLSLSLRFRSALIVKYVHVASLSLP